jgi:hypothetical protein
MADVPLLGESRSRMVSQTSLAPSDPPPARPVWKLPGTRGFLGRSHPKMRSNFCYASNRRASIVARYAVLFGGMRHGLPAAGTSRLSVSLYGGRFRSAGMQHRDRLAPHGDLDPPLPGIAVILLSSFFGGWYSTEKSLQELPRLGSGPDVSATTAQSTTESLEDRHENFWIFMKARDVAHSQGDISLRRV